MPTDRYFDEWPESTSIAWWNEGRGKLNAVVRQVNAWTCDDKPVGCAPGLLRVIDCALQTFANTAGADGWASALREMRDYVQECSTPAPSASNEGSSGKTVADIRQQTVHAAGDEPVLVCIKRADGSVEYFACDKVWIDSSAGPCGRGLYIMAGERI